MRFATGRISRRGVLFPVFLFAIALQIINKPVLAQLPGGEGRNHNDKPVYKMQVSTESAEVNDYRSFQAYVAKEAAKSKRPRTTNETGVVRKVLREKGIEFSSSSVWSIAPDRSMFACQSPDNSGVSIINTKLRKVEIIDVNGNVFQAIPYSKSPDGRIAFSDTRLFVVKDGVGWDFGFEIYDFSGKLVRDVRDLDIRGFVVSNNKKVFAVTTSSPKSERYFIIYDMDGNELWRHDIEPSANSQIQFSPDDIFALVRIPSYWSNTKPQILKERKSYLFDIKNKRLISEEDY